jgi:hypothetical protein
MFTTGSKFLIGSAVFAIIATIAYGISQDGVMGTIGLASAAAALSFLAGVNIFTHDSNVSGSDASAIDSCAAAEPAPANSIWPLAFALGAVVLAVGLITYQAVFIIGIVLLLAAGAEWTTQAWAEQASAEAAHNSEVRSRIANPLEFPLAAAIGVGLIVYAFSRVMLWLSKTNTVIALGVLGAIIVSVAFLLAYRPGLRSRTAVAVIGVGVLALVVGGAAAGLDGERDVHEQETTVELAHEGICESPEEFEADHNASQSVAATAAVAATITLDDSGELNYELNGPRPEGATALTLQRSNPSNVLFSNKSGEERRLSLDLGPATAGSGADEEDAPHQVCTTLVEFDGEQNLTLIIGLPSIAAEDGYHFFVPGVESAELELIVP